MHSQHLGQGCHHSHGFQHCSWAPCNLCLKSDKMNQAKWDKTLLPHSQNELIIYIKEKILETQLGWFNSEINTMQKCQLWPQMWSFLNKAQSISEVRQEMFSREHYWVQGGAPAVLFLSILPLVPGPCCSFQSPTHGSRVVAEQYLAPEGKFKSSAFLSGGRCSLLCGISLKVTNSNYLFFWWSEGSESACSDGSKEKPGISKTYSKKGKFSLALSTGKCAEIVKASERAWFPQKFASPENMEKLPFSQGSSEDKFLLHTACWSSCLPSLSRWMRFC